MPASFPKKRLFKEISGNGKMKQNKRTHREKNTRAVLLSVLISAQIIVYLVAYWLFNYGQDKGYDGLGNQVVLGGLFLALSVVNLILLVEYIIWQKRNRIGFSRVVVVLLLFLLPLVVLLFL